MVTGPIRSGKTTAIKMVVKALQNLHSLEMHKKTVLF